MGWRPWPPRGSPDARAADAPRLRGRPPASPRDAGLALAGRRAHRGRRPARRVRRAGPDLPSPGRPARRRGRQHLLVRLAARTSCWTAPPTTCSATSSAVADRRPSRGRASDPIDDLRTIAVTLFDAIVERPWLGAYFMRNTGRAAQLPAALRAARPSRSCASTSPRASAFHAVSAVVGFVVGTAADMGQEPPEEVASGEVGPRGVPRRYADASGGRSTRTSSPSCTTSSTSSPATTTPTSSAPGSTSCSPASASRPRADVATTRSGSTRRSPRPSFDVLGRQEEPLLTSPQVRGPFALVAAGEGFEPLELSRRIYSRTAVRL